MDINRYYHNPIFLFLRKHLRNKIFNHRLFFCINSGRSGSKYLSNLLGTSKEVISYHEPNPKMNGKYLEMVTYDSYENSFEKRRIKSYAIQNKLIFFRNNQIYCETNHMFIKTFYDIIVNDFKNVEVITLRRSLPAVLKSFIECGYFSKNNTNWPKWMHNIKETPDAFPFTLKTNAPDQYDLSISYILDMEYRAKKFSIEYPWIRNVEVDIENLNNWDHVNDLFLKLQITPTDSTMSILNRHANKKKNMKNKLNQKVSIDYCKHRIEEYLKNLDIQGCSATKIMRLNGKI